MFTKGNGDEKRDCFVEQGEEIFSEISCDAVLIMENGYCTDANKNALEMFNYRYNELMGTPGGELVTSEFKKIVQTNMTTGSNEPYRALCKKKNGVIFFAELMSKIINRNDQIFIATSIHPVEAEKKLSNDYKYHIEKFREIVDSARDLMWETDSEGYFTYVNPAVSRVTGLLSHEIIGIKIWSFILNDKKNSSLNFENFLKNKKLLTFLKTEIINKKGEIVILETNTTPLIGRDGNITGIRGVSRDITERVNSEKEELKVYFTGLSQLEEFSSLMGGVIHDLNNVLSGILVYPELLLQKMDRYSYEGQMVESIYESGMRACEIVQALISIQNSFDVTNNKDLQL